MKNTEVQTITQDYVDGLIDFEPTAAIKSAGIGKIQKSGAVALFNMLVRNGVAYLADEVGMGKTYIGLAVMSLLRFQKPDARVLIITPRRNIQEKWAADLTSFVSQNWLYADHRVKTPQGSPDWPAYMPDRLSDWVNDLCREGSEAHDTILRMSAFSLGISQDTVDHEIARFKARVPDQLWPQLDQVLREPTQAKFAHTISELIVGSPYDLIIVDEAHNLKYGYREGEPSSNRNETLHHIFAHATRLTGKKPWLLMLSATPMENGDPASLVRQFECFGRDQDVLYAPDGQLGEAGKIASLAKTMGRKQAHELQKRLIVRRVGELRLQDNSRYTRNMYRREWRLGGVEHPELPMSSSSTTERLVNAVIQKNVFELIQTRSQGRFRIGALESFEIYSGAASSVTENEDKSGQVDQVLPDQRLIADLCESYRETFSKEVPHPKLNAVSRKLSEHIACREKALVFVRRVATTTDLASRASKAFDDEILSMMRAIVSESDHAILDEVANVWSRKRSRRDFEDLQSASEDDEDEVAAEHDLSDEQEDSSITDLVPSLFTWFFRGEHKAMVEFKDIISGRRFRELLEARNRFSLILEENYVDWVLKRPIDVIGQLAGDVKLSKTEVIVEIARLVPAHYRQDNYRRAYHAVQYAGLVWMRKQACYKELSEKLDILIDEIFGLPAEGTTDTESVPVRTVQEFLSLRSLYPAFSRCEKGSPVWCIVARGVFEDVSEAQDFSFRQALRRREQIRHMQMTALRHGAPVIDFYCAFIKAREGDLRVEREIALPVEDVSLALSESWSALTTDQWRASGAWELAEMRESFDIIRKLNFPSLDTVKERSRPLDAVFIDGKEASSDGDQSVRSVRRMLGQELAGQSPTTAAMGGQDDQRRHRITTQFRMPGMPWIVIATNVYEEGVDLHTYCKTVVHHGISHTASSVEQRTGRVDRIGVLICS